MTPHPEVLKACPFCGSEASPNGIARYGEHHVKEQGWKQDEFYYCNCMSCGVSNKGIVGHQTRDLAIAAWNRRASQEAAAPSEEPVAQLGGAPDDLHNLIKVVFADMTIERMGEVCKEVIVRRSAPYAAPAVAPVAVSDVTIRKAQWAYEREITKAVDAGLSGEGLSEARFGAIKAAIEAARILSSIIPATKGGEIAAAALRKAEQFIVNGVELGFIRMPDAGTADPAHDTLPAIRAALAALSAQDMDGVAKP